MCRFYLRLIQILLLLNYRSLGVLLPKNKFGNKEKSETVNDS